MKSLKPRIAVVAIVATALALPRSERVASLRHALLGYALPATVYVAWRWSWYGLPFPLPFYVKLAHPGRLPGWPDVRAWVLGHSLLEGLLVLAALTGLPRTLRPALLIVLALTAFFVLPQHLMGYQSRYLSPLEPLVAALATLGLTRLTARRPAWFAPLVTAVTLVPVVLALAPVAADRLTYADGLEAAHLPLGRDLRRLGTHGTLVMSDGGATPYTCGWWTLDLTGLDDATIAVTHRRDPARVLALAPDAVVLVSRSREHFTPWDWNAYEGPVADTLVAHGYAHVDTRRFADDYWLWVLARPGSRVATALARR